VILKMFLMNCNRFCCKIDEFFPILFFLLIIFFNALMNKLITFKLIFEFCKQTYSNFIFSNASMIFEIIN